MRSRPRSPWSLLRRLVVVALVSVAGTLGMSPAFADTGTEASAASAAFAAGQRVYVSPASGQQLDAAVLTEKIGEAPIYVAVVPPNTPPADVELEINNVMSEPVTLVVVSGNDYLATSDVMCSDRAQPLLQQARDANQESVAAGDLGGWLTGYVDLANGAPAAGSSECADEGDGGSSLLSVLPWILGAIALAAGGGYLWLTYRRKQKVAGDDRRRRHVLAVLDELARQIDAIDDSTDRRVLLALDDARGRHIASADILTDADGDSDYAAAMRAAREGLAAVAYAARTSGRPAGTPPAVSAPRGEVLSTEREVSVGGEPVTVSPEYVPGSPHYFAGNRELPAGWYPIAVGDEQLLGTISGDEGQ